MSLHGFSWVIEGELAAMAAPDGEAEDLEELRRLGIRALVNLMDWDLHSGLGGQEGIECLHLPIPDFAAPRPDQVDAFVDFLERSRRAGRPVAVHCVAGKGRTGTMIACYFVHQGMGAEEAMKSIRKLRPGSIETESQEAAVRAYAGRVHGSTWR